LAVSAQAQSPRSAEDFEKRGEQRYLQNDYDGAISDFTLVIEISSHPGSKADLLRNSWAASNDLAGKQVTVVDPRAAFAYANRGIARMAKGDTDGAISDFDEALSISPG